jgi:2-keto-4-pentenoate hydratase/2-oxohepta-3-ene-1,7-dioic acid hydratase in catechol pathway
VRVHGVCHYSGVRLALFDTYRFGLVTGDEIRDVTDALAFHDPAWPWDFVPRAIAAFDDLRPKIERLAAEAPPRPLSQVRLLPPIPQPGKIVAAAANYMLHHQEMGGSTLQGEVFLKAPTSVVGPSATVRLPNVPGRKIEHEVELAVVIGRQAKNLREETAMSCVFGYTGLMDLTVRGQGDRSRRKSYDGFTPIGPWIVTADEIADPHNLRLRLWNSGQLRQDGSTSDLVDDIPVLLAYASSVMTLQPGDILATGTPAGVGPVAGDDTLAIEIEQIGRLEVSIQAAEVDAPIAEPGRLRVAT